LVCQQTKPSFQLLSQPGFSEISVRTIQAFNLLSLLLHIR
jgi:hypothetical protein